MSTFNEQLRQEISTVVHGLVERKQNLHPQWIAQEICASHANGIKEDSDDAAFCRSAMYRTVIQETGAYLRRWFAPEAEQDDGTQKTLPGFEHMQTHYIVKRDDEDIAVHADSITEDEFIRIAERLRAVGVASIAHADEILDYLRKRQQSALPLASSP